MRKFGRKKSNRTHLIKNLATSIVLYEQVVTTKSKAKEAVAEIDRIMNIAKKNNLDSRRRLLGYFSDQNAVKKIYEVFLPKLNKRSGGFAKIYRFGHRVGDGASKVIVKLSIDLEKVKVEDKKTEIHHKDK